MIVVQVVVGFMSHGVSSTPVQIIVITWLLHDPILLVVYQLSSHSVLVRGIDDMLARSLIKLSLRHVLDFLRRESVRDGRMYFRFKIFLEQEKLGMSWLVCCHGHDLYTTFEIDDPAFTYVLW